MSPVTLALLGTPQVQLDGRPLPLPTRKALALLAYLAVEGGVHAREKLAALLWPDLDAPQARQAVRTTLARLRRALRDHASCLVVDQHTVALQAADLDVLELRAASADQAAPPDVLRRIVARYRGDFLEGFALPDAPEFDQWAAVRREQCHQQLAGLLARLVELLLDSGDARGAAAAASTWVAHDGLSEAAYRRLMQAYLVAGDRAAALQAYEACRAVLAAELGIAPAPETDTLAAAARRAPPLPTVAPRPADPLAAVELPLVGRAREHAALASAFHTARAGRLQLAVIEGEPGIGKSRLALEFLGWAAAHGADVLRGQAFEAGGRLPYQPVITALRPRLDRERAPDDLLADVWLAELSRLLPELRDRYPDLAPPGADDEAARGRLFEAVARLGFALARQAPLVLLVDDIQWADTATRDLLHYAARRWAEESAAAMLVLTLRAEADGELAAWRAEIERLCPVTRLPLTPLQQEDVVRAVVSLAGETPAGTGAVCPATEPSPAVGEFARWLYVETGGQPFFMVEMLRTLLERGLLAAHPAAGRGWRLSVGEVGGAGLRGLIPTRVREVILARAVRVGDTAGALLVAGAALGQRFGFAQLCGVAGVAEDVALPALDQLLRARLLVEIDDRRDPGPPPRSGQALREGAPARRPAEGWEVPRPATYAFAHDTIRAVVYAEAGEARRSVLHRRAFERLHADGAAPATLAYHASRAGLAAAGLRYSVLAGDEALRLFAVRDAIEHYERALREATGLGLAAWDAGWGDAAPAGTVFLPRLQPLAARLYLGLGRAYELANEFERARDSYRELLAYARAHEDDAAEWAALGRLITIATLTFDQAALAELLPAARRAAGRAGAGAALAELEWNLAQAAFYRLDFDEAVARGRAALAHAREHGPEELTARCLNIIAYGHLGLQQWPAVERAAGEARALFAARGDRAMEVDNLCLIAAARISRGRTADGIAAGRAARDRSAAIENAWGRANSAMQLVPGLLDAGALGEALAVALEGVAAARVPGNPMLAGCLVRLGAVRRALLDLEGARAAHDEALAISEANPHRPFSALAAAELCADAALAGAWDEAGAYAVRANEGGTLLHLGRTAWFEVEALLRAGEDTLAEEVLGRLAIRAAEHPRYRLPHLRALAVRALHTGDPAAALAHLEEAAALAGAHGWPAERWPIAVAIGELRQARGDPAGAQAVFEQAGADVRALAASIDDERLRAGLLGVLAAWPYPSTRSQT
ncbi:MAG TPA: AAA family ATPase [Roseiflexaceae bacterium]|nr:AAA family ATPase [Roseiflexaceae bacterium]